MLIQDHVQDLVYMFLYTLYCIQFSIWICVHIGYPVIISDRRRFLCRVSFWKEKKPKFSQKSFFFRFCFLNVKF